MGQRRGFWAAIFAVQSGWELVLTITEVFVPIAFTIPGDFPDRNHSADFSCNFTRIYSDLLGFTRIYPDLPEFTPIYPDLPDFTRISSKIYGNRGSKAAGVQRRGRGGRREGILDLRFAILD
jgi:hypothetical protein